MPSTRLMPQIAGLWRVRGLLKASCFGRVSCRCFGQPAPQTHPHLVSEGEVTPGISMEEYSERRRRLMSSIYDHPSTPHHGHHIAIIPAATRLYMTHDIPYMFRQNTDFLYLCGFMEPNSVLVLQSRGHHVGGHVGGHEGDHVSTLFVPKRDVSKEMWEGPRSGVEGAPVLTGVDRAETVENLCDYLSCYHRDHSDYMVWYDYNKPSNIEIHIRFLTDFLKHKLITSPRRLIQRLRAVKSPAEVKLMRQSCDITSRAFRHVMAASHPGVNESQLHARMEYECRVERAEYLAYPPVVAGGNRANTIHYIQNNQLVMDGELVLMDAGCEYHGYASDITRTWPVSGSFSPVQRQLYEALLEVNESCISMVTPDSSIESIFSHMLTQLGLQLQRLGVVPPHVSHDDLQRFGRSFCPHHVGHYLGMDVHDTDEMSRTDPLTPGMVVTIEPGIYIPHTKTSLSPELRGLGLRIEDDILVTNERPENLTRDCPKHPDDVEAAVRAGDH